MTKHLSQDYSVDNRYRGHEEAQDNEPGLRFLSQYMERSQAAKADNLEQQRLGDGRFTFAGEGGTIPVAALPFDPRGAASISNTDRRVGFRNLFRTQPS